MSDIIKCSSQDYYLINLENSLSLPYFFNTVDIISVQWLMQKKTLMSSGRKRGTSQLNALFAEDYQV